jgi:hypothetical protein
MHIAFRLESVTERGHVGDLDIVGGRDYSSVKMVHRETCWKHLKWIELAQNKKSSRNVWFQHR